MFSFTVSSFTSSNNALFSFEYFYLLTIGYILKLAEIFFISIVFPQKSLIAFYSNMKLFIKCQQIFIQETLFKKILHACCTYINLFICICKSVFIQVAFFYKILLYILDKYEIFHFLGHMADFSNGVFEKNLSFIIWNIKLFTYMCPHMLL